MNSIWIVYLKSTNIFMLSNFCIFNLDTILEGEGEYNKLDTTIRISS